MGIGTLLDLASATYGDRVALGRTAGGTTFAELGDLVPRAARVLDEAGGHHVAYLGVAAPSFTVATFAAAQLGRPIVPLNYRLPAADLSAALAQLADPLLLVDGIDIDAGATRTMTVTDWLGEARTAAPAAVTGEGAGEGAGDPTAVVLFTSGTTAAPKGVLLTHDQLLAYVLTTVEFAADGPPEATLVTVPPYHVAGVASVLTNLYAGRRVLHLPTFDAGQWLELVRSESIASATLVPTMLARLVEHLDAAGAQSAEVPSLRSLSYGGAPLAPRVLERALALFEGVGFVNAYGLTETSSTIAVLGPDDHRAAASASDLAGRARLASAGRPIPGIEVCIRDDDGHPVQVGRSGDLFVRGPQVSGTYLREGTTLDAEGWFPTRDRAHQDQAGFLFVEGRADDTIIRGAENVAPAEIEAVLRDHDDVGDVAVVGLPDEQWGQRIGAAVVLLPGSPLTPGALREWAGRRLRSSRTPEVISIVDALPYSPTGKLLRRVVAEELLTESRRIA